MDWGDWKPPRPLEHNYCPTCGEALIEAHDGQDERPHCPPCNRFFYRNPIPASACFVYKPSGELLFTQRAVQPCKGAWTLPGGFVEMNETTEEAALRELREETNLSATAGRLLGVSTRHSPTSGAVMVLGYIIDTWEGEADMKPDTDAADLRFFPRDEWPTPPFHTHQDLLRQFLQHLGQQ